MHECMHSVPHQTTTLAAPALVKVGWGSRQQHHTPQQIWHFDVDEKPKKGAIQVGSALSTSSAHASTWFDGFQLFGPRASSPQLALIKVTTDNRELSLHLLQLYGDIGVCLCMHSRSPRPTMPMTTL